MPRKAVDKGADSTTQKGRSRAFLLLLAGSSVSMLGSRVTTIAYPMLVLYLTGSPVDAGWVAFAATAPSVLAYIPAGALVDVMDPKRVMLLSEFGRGVAIAWVVAMVAMGWRSIPLFIIAAVIEETLEVFSALAERRYVGALVERDQVSPALARVEARTHVVVLAGRPLGGMLFELWPIAPFLFDVLTFIASVAALLGIKRRQPADRLAITSLGRCIGTKGQFRKAITRLDQPPDWHIKNDIGEGLGWLGHNRFARAAMALLASTTLISQALIIVFITEAYSRHMSSSTVGIVLAMSGLGGALGSALASRLRALFKYSWIRVQMLVWSVAFTILAISGGQSPVYMGMTMTAMGFMGAMSNIEFDTYLIEIVPENMLARVTSIGRMVSFTACATGPLIAGFLFGMYGARATVDWLTVATIFLAAYSVLAQSMRERSNCDIAGAPQAAVLGAWARRMAIGRQLTDLASSCWDAVSVAAEMTVRMVSMSLRSLIRPYSHQVGQVSVTYPGPNVYAHEPVGQLHATAELHPQARVASRL